jgi:short-subunit dehydrogenase
VLTNGRPPRDERSSLARRRNRLLALAEEIECVSSVRVEVIAADLVQPHDLRQVEEQVTGEGNLEFLFNCADFGVNSRFQQTDLAAKDAIFNQANTTGTLAIRYRRAASGVNASS